MTAMSSENKTMQIRVGAARSRVEYRPLDITIGTA